MFFFSHIILVIISFHNLIMITKEIKIFHKKFKLEYLKNIFNHEFTVKYFVSRREAVALIFFFIAVVK